MESQENVLHSVPQLCDLFDIGKLLGHGTYARVYRAKTKTDLRGVKSKTVVALKIFVDGNVDVDIQKEVAMLKRLSSYGQCSPNVIGYYDDLRLQHKGEVRYVIVMQYVRGVELSDFINEHSHSPSTDGLYDILSFLSVCNIHKIFSQLLEGLVYMHSRNIAHRDVKSNNIIIDNDNLNVKYIDFGYACMTMVDAKSTDYIERRGTREFISPELAKLGNTHKNVDTNDDIELLKKADVWALGIVFYELLFGVTPTMKLVDDSKSRDDYFRTIASLVIDKLPFYNPSLKRFADITLLMLRSDYKRRIDAETALSVLNG